MDSKASNPTLPFVWPLPFDGTGLEGDGPRIPFEDAVADAESIAGIVSGIESRGVDWVEELLRDTDRRALVILAVYAGCPTRSDDLLRLLKLQGSRTPKVEFRILPKSVGNGAPANCLAAIPLDGFNPVLFFGNTPNLSIAKHDATHLNMAFHADPLLTDKWGRWFDNTWAEASALTESTAMIPSLVPARGSADAAAQWREYCESLMNESEQRKPEETPTSDEHDSESSAEEEDSTQGGPEDQAPSETIGIRKLDELADRVMRMLQNGKQVVIGYDSVVKPIKVSVTPDLFGQLRETWDGPVVQFQSFQVSAFSKKELKLIESYRTCSQSILEKLGLPLGSGLYWMPTKMILIYNREISLKDKEARETLNRIIGPHSRTFLDGKREQIEQFIKRTHLRLGGDGNPPQEILDKVLNRLLNRIDNALKSSLVAQPAYSEIKFTFHEQHSLEAAWAQVQKLVMAVTRFPRKALSRHDIPSGLATPKSWILQAMDIENDTILEIDRYYKERARKESHRDLRLLNLIDKSDIGARDRCKACFMMIDGIPRNSIQQFVERIRPQD